MNSTWVAPATPLKVLQDLQKRPMSSLLRVSPKTTFTLIETKI